MITQLTLQKHTPENIDNLVAFLERYRAAYPDAKLATAELYTYRPAAENRANVFCVCDGKGQMRGLAKIILEVKQSNAPAIAFYRSMGYKIINEEVFVGRWL